MVREFVNREEELDFLNRKWSEEERQLIVLYGRRRTGKTELINRFSRDKNSIYFLADERSIEENLDLFSEKAADRFDDVKPEPGSFDDLFQYILNRAETPVVVAIDEFSYLVETDESIPSVFQRIWDETLEGEEIFLILCGSSISMMREGALSYDSPLYGRRTGQWKLNALGFSEASKFLSDYSTEERIRAYSVLGGIPAYLQQFDPEKELGENIEEKILSKGTYLYEEPEFILRQSLRKPSRYMEILEEMAYGATKTSEIAIKVGIETSNISPYLNKLQEMELVKKETPVTAGEKSHGVYRIADNFFRFYFRFIYPNKAELESNRTKEIKDTITRNIDSYASTTFEGICQEKIRETEDYSKVGRWWYREEEIDVAALNEKENRILLGECKWTSKPVDTDLLEKLEDKAEKVRWGETDRTEKYALFSRNGFTDKLEQKAEKRKDLKLHSIEKLPEQQDK